MKLTVSSGEIVAQTWISWQNTGKISVIQQMTRVEAKVTVAKAEGSVIVVTASRTAMRKFITLNKLKSFN